MKLFLSKNLFVKLCKSMFAIIRDNNKKRDWERSCAVYLKIWGDTHANEKQNNWGTDTVSKKKECHDTERACRYLVCVRQNCVQLGTRQDKTGLYDYHKDFGAVLCICELSSYRRKQEHSLTLGRYSYRSFQETSMKDLYGRLWKRNRQILLKGICLFIGLSLIL